MINEDIGRVNEGTTIFPVGQKEMQGPATECLAVPVFHCLSTGVRERLKGGQKDHKMQDEAVPCCHDLEGSGAVRQLVKCSPSMHETLGSITRTK